MPRPTIAPQRREEILQAFEACALRKGLDATTLTDVAEEAGLPRSLVRHFVGNRDAMVSGLIERMFSRATQSIEQALSRSESHRQADLVQLILTQSFADPISNKLMVQLWQKGWHDDQLSTQITDVYQRCIEQIHDRLFSNGSQATYDQAYALTAMAMGHAVFGQFGIRPHDHNAFTKTGLAVTRLANRSSKKGS